MINLKLWPRALLGLWLFFASQTFAQTPPPADASGFKVIVKLIQPDMPPPEENIGTWTYHPCGGQPDTEAGTLECKNIPYQNPAYAPCGLTTVVLAPGAAWHTDEESQYYAGVARREFKQTLTTTPQYDSDRSVYPPAIVCTQPVEQVNPRGLMRTRSAACPAGYHVDAANTICVSTIQGAITGRPNTCTRGSLVGDPCDVATGDNVITEVDYSGPHLHFDRIYHSIMHAFDAGLGVGWTHSYFAQVIFSNGTPFMLVRPTGYQEPLFRTTVTESGAAVTVYLSQTGSGGQLRHVGANWVLHKQDGAKEIYDANGVLQQLQAANGSITNLAYNNGKLVSVTGPYGHKLTLNYDSNNQYLMSITDPSEVDITYEYDDEFRLSGVTYQDETTRTYLYNESGRTNGEFPNHLTGIIDENTDRYSTYEYDDNGRVTLNEHGGGTDRLTLSYSTTTTTVTDNASPANVTTYNLQGVQSPWTWTHGTDEFNSLAEAVEDARYNNTRLHMQPLGGISGYTNSTSAFRIVTGKTLGGSGSTSSPSSDYARRRNSETDERGNVTTYGYDTFHRRTVTEAEQTTDYERTTTTDYLGSTSDLPVLVTSPSVAGGNNVKAVTTTYVVGTQLTESVTISGYDPAQPSVLLERTTNFDDYNLDTVSGTADDFQPGTIDGPRTDVSDVVELEYWDESSPGIACTTTPGGACGQLKTMTNALGHITSFNEYYPDGRLKKMTDPNLLVATYAYYERGQLDTVTEGTRITDYDYDDAGQLVKVTMPNGLVLNYEWTDAQLLDYITDNLGNKIDYGYDSRGNRTSEDIKDASGTLRKSLSRTYDARNRIDALQEGPNAAANLNFDAAGLLEDELDANSKSTDYEYDPLNRLVEIVDPQNGSSASTLYGYNVHDDLTSVQSPNGAPTTYVYDDLGNLRKEVSKDRGTTLYGYDAAGNMTCKADGRYSATTATCEGVEQRWTYTYDALNRVKTIDFGATASINPDQSFTYDQGTGQAGRRTSVTYTFSTPTGNKTIVSDYTYDAFGNVLTAQQTVPSGTGGADKVLLTQYEYNGGDQLVKVTHPSGRAINYIRDPVTRRITDITATRNGVTTTIVWGIEYEPFGPPKLIRYQNTQVQTRSYDTAYRLTGNLLGDTYSIDDSLTYDLDDVGNVDSITDNLNSSHSSSYTYDNLYRLTYESALGGIDYGYDGNGNRISVSGGWYGDQDPTFVADTNRFDSLYWDTTTYDGAGNLKCIYGLGSCAAYNAGNRVSSITYGPALRVQYNGLGEPTRTDLDVGYGGWRYSYYYYTPDGKPLGMREDEAQSIGREWVYLDDLPVAQIEDIYNSSGTLVYTRPTYLHPDHLGTPRVGTDSTATIVWHWESDAFGLAEPVGTHAVPLRFPGQIDSGQSTYRLNYHRTYDARLGRYLESDPIGLEAGVNTYTYVENNPLSKIDPRGELAWWVIPAGILIWEVGNLTYDYYDFYQCVKQCPTNCGDGDTDGGDTRANAQCKAKCTLRVWGKPDGPGPKWPIGK